jgi:hypothetical protein
MKTLFFSLVLLISTSFVFSQKPVGGWRDHLCYLKCRKIVKVDNLIYCATEQNLFIFNTLNNSIEKLTTITGLSDVGVNNIAYYKEQNILFISYTNGNIDLIQNKKVSNIPDLKNKLITAQKGANDITFSGNYAYCSHDFGILVVDLAKKEIKDTYTIGEAGLVYKVNSIQIKDDYFYAATNKGIFTAPINDPYLVDYTRWQLQTNISAPKSDFDNIILFNGNLITNSIGSGNVSDSLYVLTGNKWNKIKDFGYSGIKELSATDNNLIITLDQNVYVLNKSYDLVFHYNKFNPLSAITDNDNLWVGDFGNGLIKQPLTGAEVSYIYPSGPASNFVWNMKPHFNSIIATAGGVNASWGKIGFPAITFRFKNEQWYNIYENGVADFVSICGDPQDPERFFVGDWGKGIFEYYENKFVKKFDQTNSSLRDIIPNDPSCYIGGITFDSDNNMWVTNQQVPNPISVRKSNGQWKSYKYNYLNDIVTLGDILNDVNNNFWVIIPRDCGLMAFNTNGTIDTTADDKTVGFKPQDAFNLVIKNTYCLVNDRDGSVWAGTERGAVVYTNPAEIFEGVTGGYQPRISRNTGDNAADPLLYGESVYSIAVDGANRKWFGTEKGGAFLMSPDGTKEILHFTKDNSPLFSNFVRTIAIHPETGEVFFGTDKGIISYRGTATEPKDGMDAAYAFPNPVRPDYNGPITITGLVENTSVKITDISGNLVYQTSSLGGSAMWDGKTRKGTKAATGVYLVFLTSEDGEQTNVIKLLIIH